MQRLPEQNINTAKEYERIFFDRRIKGVDDFDLRRWRTLLKKYKGGKLIDLGTLDSLVPIMAKGMYPQAEIWGLDQAEEAIKQMQEQYRQIYYKVGDVYQTGFKDEEFNYIVMGEVLEHLENPELAILEAMRILKVGGTLAISVPFDEAKEPGAVDKDRHIWSFTKEDFEEILKPFGKLRLEVLRSFQKPVYRYCWPQLLVWVTKK